MRIKEKTIYQFDELSESAKERARDWYRQASSDDFDDWDVSCVIDDAARLAALFGLNIRTKPVKLMNGSTRDDPNVSYSGFSSQGDGASFSGVYSYRKGSVRAVEDEAPSGTGNGYEGNNELNRIVRELAQVQRRNFYMLGATIDDRRSRSFTLDVDVERTDDKPVPDNDVETVKECMRDFAHYIYRQLEREYEYRQSDEVVSDNIRANEYEFDEHGNRDR